MPRSSTCCRRWTPLPGAILVPVPATWRPCSKSSASPSLDALVDQTVPANIRREAPLNLPPAQSESEVLADLQAIAAQNQLWRTYIGMGYYDTLTPPVIQRNILENPGWYTPTRPIRRRSPRAGSRRCSTSRR